VQAAFSPVRPAPGLEPVLATLFGIPAAIIVLAAARGEPAPIVGDGAAALVALWVLGSAMCALGMRAMQLRFGQGRSNLTGSPLGLLATALILSGLFGWPLLLRPIADALGGAEVPFVRAAIVGVGAVMALKWTIAWLSYLPRRAGSSPAGPRP
jgi:hypothetical protein